MAYRAVTSKLAQAAAVTGAAAATNPPTTAVTEAYRPRDNLAFGKAFNDGSRHSSLAWSSASSSDWNLVISNDFASRQEFEDATKEVIETLQSDPALSQSGLWSDPATPMTWPEADASMAASEAAIAAAQRALLVSSTSSMPLHGSALSTSSGAVVAGPVADAIRAALKHPEDLKKAVSEAAMDPIIWERFMQKQSFVALLQKTQSMQITEAENEQQVGNLASSVMSSTEPQPDSIPTAFEAKAENASNFRTFLHNVVVGLGSIVNSISSFFRAFGGNGEEQSRGFSGQDGTPHDQEKPPPAGAIITGVILLALCVVATIVFKRR